MRTKITNPKAVQQKSRLHKVLPLTEGKFRVISGTSDKDYIVRMQPGKVEGCVCNCEWGQKRPSYDSWRSGCSHVIAVYNYLESTGNRTASVWTDPEEVKRQHRSSYKIGDGVILTSKMRYEPKRFRLYADAEIFEVKTLQEARNKWLELANTFNYKTWRLYDLTLKETHSKGTFVSKGAE